MSNKSHLTAIKRKSSSLPCKYLFGERKLLPWLSEHVLDYGCGRGFDADFFGVRKYDPHYFPTRPEGSFNFIYCNYVLNVIEDPMERAKVLEDISSLLNTNGVAYISVRNDRAQLNGITGKGTWQGYIELDLPVEKKCAGYVMYRLTKASKPANLSV